MNFRYSLVCLILTLVAGCLQISSASAHFLWLDSEPAGETRTGLLFFGESPQDRNYHLPVPIAAAEMFARTGEKTREVSDRCT